MYTAAECEQKIREIDDRIAELRDMPSSQSVGPYSVSVSDKIAELQELREQWEKRLDRAREYEETGSTSGVNGPDAEIC